MNACLCALSPYDIANAPHGRLRRGEQPAEGRRLPRARIADRALRGRERGGHVRQGDRHGSAGVPAEERRAHRHAHHRRAEARACRVRRDAAGAVRPPRLQGAARPQPGARRRLRLLVQRRRRLQRDHPGERRRHRAGGDRQPGHRRLARLDGADGGRDAGHRLQPGAGDRRRHRLGRLHPRHRRLARDLRHRHRGGDRGAQRGQGPVPARRDDLGRRPRGRDLGRRLRQAGRRQRRRLQAAVAEGDRGEGGGDRRADHRLGRR